MRSCRASIFPSHDGTSRALPLLLPTSRTSQNTLTAADTGFEPVPHGAKDPTADELASLADEFYARRTMIKRLGSTGENDGGDVFRGEGDPPSAADIFDAVRLAAGRRNGILFQVNALGLCDGDAVESLLSSGAVARGHADRRRETRIATVSVFLPTGDPKKCAELLRPKAGRGFGDACSFVARLMEAGLNVECTAVALSDVNAAEVRAVAMSLGATDFWKRSWIGSSPE